MLTLVNNQEEKERREAAIEHIKHADKFILIALNEKHKIAELIDYGLTNAEIIAHCEALKYDIFSNGEF